MANARQTRGSNGRFKPDHSTRNRAIGAASVVGLAAAAAVTRPQRTRTRAIGAASVVGLAAAAVGAALRFGLLDRFFPTMEGHDAPDLALDQDRPGADDRAPDAFRPHPTAT